jgi:nucleotide-binding universal stress UspA family protein
MSHAFRILVAIDLKPGTDRLLAEAQRYAKALDAIVNIVHIADPVPDIVRYTKGAQEVTDYEDAEDPDPDFVSYVNGEQETKTGAHEVTDYNDTLRDDQAKEFRLEHQQVHALAEKMRASGIRVDQALTVQGPTLEKLLKEASKLDTDLLILGSHHHGALYRLWYGDVAIDATKQAPCALLVVPIQPDVTKI